MAYHVNRPIPDDVQARVLVDYTVDESGCWITTWGKAIKGYGALSTRIDGKSYVWLAHRASWVAHNGPIPDGLVIDHKCFNHACVNPEHLRLLTRTQNNARKEKFGKRDWPLDECRWGHKLTEQKLYATKSAAPRMRCAGCVKDRNDVLTTINKQLRLLEMTYGIGDWHLSRDYPKHLAIRDARVAAVREAREMKEAA